MNIVSFFLVLALTGIQLDGREPELLSVESEALIQHSFDVTVARAENGVERIIVLSQASKSVSILNNDLKVLESWSITKPGIPFDIEATVDSKLFVACGSPSVGYYYNLNGDYLSSIKLFRNGELSISDDGTIHVSTFDQRVSGKDGPGYWVFDSNGEEVFYLDLLSVLPEENEQFVMRFLSPVILRDEVLLFGRYFPYMLRFDKQGTVTFAALVEDERFEDQNMVNIANGISSSMYQFSAISEYRNGVLASYISDDGLMNFLHISLNGEILNEFRYRVSNFDQKSISSFSILEETPLKLVAVDITSGVVRILSNRKN